MPTRAALLERFKVVRRLLAASAFTAAVLATLTVSSPAAPPAASAAKPLHLVFGLDGTLLQGVPVSQLKNYDAAKLIQVGQRHYRVADHAAEAIRKLAKLPGAKISFYSEFNRAETSEILNKISGIPQPGTSLAHLAYRIIDQEGRDPATELAKDLTKIDADLSRVVLIDHELSKVPEAQAGSRYAYQHPLYQFETFAKAQESIAYYKEKDPKRFTATEKFFPATEAAWRAHQNRIPFLYEVARKAVARAKVAPGVSIARAMREESAKNRDTVTQTGLAMLDTRLEWKVDQNSVTGCRQLSNRNPALASDVTLEECVTALPVKYAWSGAQRDNCVAVTKTGAVLNRPSPEACLAKLPVHYFWSNRELRQCGVFNQHSVMVGKAPKEKCVTDVVCDAETGVLSSFTRNLANNLVFKALKSIEEAESLGCDQPSRPVTADDSPSLGYFRRLLARGTAAPLEDFLKLWYPARGDGSDKDAFFFACEPTPFGSLRGGPDGYLPEKCAPDTMYSWGPAPKLQAIRTNAPDRGVWTQPPNAGYNSVWATLSASSTYPYGRFPIRMRLKPGIRTQVGTRRGGAGQISYEASEGRYNYQDFVVSDFSVVESWSYATPQHYDEIVRDALRTISGKRGYNYCCGAPQGVGIARLNTYTHYTGLIDFDGHDTRPESLKIALLEMLRAILNREGRIHFAQGACRNAAKHFATEKNSYMNWKQ